MFIITKSYAKVTAATLLAYQFGASVAFPPTRKEVRPRLRSPAISRWMRTYTSIRDFKRVDAVIHELSDGRSECHMCADRRTVIGVLFISPSVAAAANLPKNYGADLSMTGSIETLLPIAAIERSLINAKSQLPRTDGSYTSLATPEMCTNILDAMMVNIPREENSFKRIFDAYSTPVSYKQKFLDQNAFLVYYTNGFDGPGRPSIEEDDASNALQTKQYGNRNDEWTAIEDLFVELEFGKREGGETTKTELCRLIDNALSILDSYLKLAPVADVEEVRRRLDH